MRVGVGTVELFRSTKNGAQKALVTVPVNHNAGGGVSFHFRKALLPTPLLKYDTFHLYLKTCNCIDALDSLV